MKTSIIASALLALALPLSAFSADSIGVSSASGDINVSANPETLNGDNVWVDAYGQVSVDLPFQLNLDLKGRIDETLNSAQNEKLNQDLFWQTLEGLALRKKIFYTVAVGKVDAGFGARGTGIGETALNRQRDSLLFANSFALRSVTGVQVIVDNSIPGSSMVANVLNQVLSGVTVTFYDANASTKPRIGDFGKLNSVAARKVGEALGISYQVSYVHAKFDDGTRDQRYSISLQKCLDIACLYGEHQNLEKSDLTSVKTATTMGVSKSVRGTNLAVEYTDVRLKNTLTPASSIPAVGSNVAVVANRDMMGVNLGASYQRDLDHKDNIYRLNVNKRFGGSPQESGHIFGASAKELHARVTAE